MLAGYNGMKVREKSIPPQGKVRITEALDRLIELYSATNQPAEAKQWRAERAKYPRPPTAPRENEMMDDSRRSPLTRIKSVRTRVCLVRALKERVMPIDSKHIQAVFLLAVEVPDASALALRC